jgi:hypothetical protein
LKYNQRSFEDAAAHFGRLICHRLFHQGQGRAVK